LKKFLEVITNLNFVELYPGYNFNEILSQLKINKEGFSNIDCAEVLKGFQTLENNFNHLNLINDTILNKYLLEYNKAFNISNIIYVFKNILKHSSDEQLNIYNKIKLFFEPVEKYDVIYAKKFKTKKGSMTVKLNG